MSIGAIVGTIGNVAPTAISVYSAEEERAEIAKTFCKGNVRIAMQNPAIKHKMKDLDERWQGAVLSSGLSIACGAAAGAMVGVFTPLPFALLLGSLAGGIGGNYLYDDVLKKQAQDPLVINEQIVKMQASGQAVPEEMVFAALAANVSGKAGAIIDKKLKQYTGTEYFTEALGKPEKIAKLTALMNNPAIDDIIRTQTQMPFDPQNHHKPVAVQYTELLNSGRLDARELLNVGAGLYASNPQTIISNSANVALEVPQTPVRGQGQQVRTIT
jgi:hypothetical protein